MNQLMASLGQLVVLRDRAPAEVQLQAGADPAEARDAARFYAEAHVMLPAVVALVSDAHPTAAWTLYEPSIEALRRIRAIVRAAQAWHARTPASEADLAAGLDAAVAACAVAEPT